MLVKYGKTSKAQRRRKREEIGVIGVCNVCGQDADNLGFRCACRWTECVTCWFKRTGGHKNTKSPEWHCEKCLRVTVFDCEMNFIRRWTREQWERWNEIGRKLEQEKGKQDGYKIAEGTI